LFWVAAGSTALFGLVSSGLGLFNEAVLAERGFDRKTFEAFLAVTTLFALAGQMLCGWLSLTRPLTRLLAVAMLLYAAGLGTLPLLQNHTQLWIFAAVFGVAAGMVTVIFFAVWGQAFGRAHLGRIQGAAQLLTVFSSAIGPLLFAKSREAAGSYTPLLLCLTPVVLLSALAAWWISPRRTTGD
jgi:cyanate permease